MKSFRQYVTESKYNGKVLYHGTNVDFTKIDFNKLGRTDQGFAGKGFYLTANRELAKMYADATSSMYGGNSLVLEFVVRPHKTLELDGDPLESVADSVENMMMDPTDRGTPSKISEFLLSRGYDSIAINKNKILQEFVILKPGIASRKI